MNAEWLQLEGRLGAVLLLLAAILLAWFLLLHPVSALYRDARAEIEQDQEHLAKLRTAAAGAPALQRRFAQLQQRRDAGRHTLTGESSALAAAALQDHIKTIAARHGAELTSTNVLAPAETAGVPTVMVNVSMRMDISALQHVLYDLESGVPLVIVEAATIQTPQAEQEGPGGDAGGLIVQLDLKSFMRRTENADDTGA